ncbi:hypothetical protein AB0J72_46570 [Dactylosporangium sp. NPDC049742]|uniref:hypothetical protein n=1 Tax=Dactylosporangium sp. NPDC049742 TaxID=3154737 RepID=UPI003436DE70
MTGTLPPHALMYGAAVGARGCGDGAAGSRSMLVGGGVLLVTVALLAWELTVVVRRRRG